MRFIYLLEKTISNDKLMGIGIELDNGTFNVIWKGRIESIVTYKSISDLLEISSDTIKFKGQLTIDFLEGVLFKLEKNKII